MRCFWYFCIVLLFSCKSDKANDHLHIAVASNLQYVMKDIVAAYEKEYGQKCYLTTSSSGKLTAQIKSAAPYDIFLSADMDYPKVLFEDSLCSSPEIFAYGQLVLWSMHENVDLSKVLREGNKIAIANPSIAPYGRAAKAYLAKLGKDNIELIQGESIAQVNQYIINGAVDAGITSLSSVMATPMKGKGVWQIIDKELYPPLPHAVVRISQDTKHSTVDAFYQYLFSVHAQRLFEEHGYVLAL